MTEPHPQSRSVHVVVAAAVVVVLAGLLAARLLARSEGPGGAAVPLPAARAVADLAVPCWSCPESRTWRSRFQTDLDLLAPLGTGGENAGIWFGAFSKVSGPRYSEARAAMERRSEHPELKKILPPDDPLLLEAEPWCDQASMSFYPDVFKPNGFATEITNLLLPLAMAKSWVARGQATDDPDQAIQDFRRAIRVGRLLRQEDVIVINDLVGLACIRIGTQAIYDLALARGDLELALLASVVLGEVAPQRLRASERVTTGNISDFSTTTSTGEVGFDVPDNRLEELLKMATDDPDRRFRCEAVVGLNLLGHLSPPDQRARVLEVLDTLASDDDPIIADLARWSRDKQPSEEYVQEALAEAK